MGLRLGWDGDPYDRTSKRMAIFTLSRAALSKPLSEANSKGFDAEMLRAAEEALEHFAVPERTPIVIREWALDERLTDFGIHVARRHRTLTAESYARECEVFCRFLDQVLQRDLAAISEDDFWKYRSYRLLGPISVRVQPVTWNKIAAALVAFKRHLKLPFDFDWRDWRETGGDDRTVRMIGLAEYKTFCDLGLRQGSRTPLRNAAFAELLVTTGMRCSEANSLLSIDLPAQATFGKHNSVKVTLPSSITKGGHKRSVYYSKRVAHSFIETYSSEERAHSARSQIDRTFRRKKYSEGELSRLTDHFFIEVAGPGRVRAIGQLAGSAVVPTALLTPAERARSIVVERAGTSFEIVDLGPLWLSETGTSIQRTSWNSTFRGAQDRAQPSVKVTPHVLRHTFAVHYLDTLLRELVDWRQLRSTLNRRGEIYDRLVRDPLYELQKRLGHRQLTTTRRYLTYTHDHQDYVDRVVAEWDAMMAHGRP